MSINATEAIARIEAMKDPEVQRQVMLAMGRRGGLKGGRIRAERLSPERRREIAKAAAAKRWYRSGSQPSALSSQPS
jgi:hypothetical protein